MRSIAIPARAEEIELLRGEVEAMEGFAPAVDLALRAMASESASATRIATIIETDAPLTRWVLAVANSPYYGLPRPIAQAKHAVAYLGFEEARRLVLVAGFLERFPPERSEPLRSFWSHALLSTAVADRLATSRLKVDDFAATRPAALLHGIGRLVCYERYPGSFEMLHGFCRREGARWIDAERHFAPPAHATLGALLCDAWNLPTDIRNASERHEPEDLARDASAATRLVCVSSLLAELAIDELAPEVKRTIHDAVQRTLDCDEQDFLLLMGEIYEVRPAIERFLDRVN